LISEWDINGYTRIIINKEKAMKPSRGWLFLLVAIISCNLPFHPPAGPTASPSSRAPELHGSWHGTLQDLTTNSNLGMNLYLEKTQAGFSGRVEFTLKDTVTESYEISGLQAGNEFQFNESNGRSFWGVLEQETLHGFVAWDCFKCDHWGEFTLTRRTDLEPVAAQTASHAAQNLIRFEGIANGDTITGSVDPLTRLPTAMIGIASDDPGKAIFLDADGLATGYFDLNGQSVAQLQWTPWHGNGAYVLDAYLMQSTSAAGTIVSQESIQVNVSGIPAGTPTVSERFSQLFLERYGFYPQTPAFTRYIRLFPEGIDPSQWVSAVYYDDYSYELRITDDGQVTQYYTYANFDDEYSICRPSGIIRMLAVIVDYGNTGTDPNLVVDDLHQSLAMANQRWADYSSRMGLSQSILQVELTTALAGAPSTPGQYLTTAEVSTRTGFDPAQFDLLAEIDLDRDNLATGQYGGLGVSLSGGCRPSGPSRVNIGMNVNASEYFRVGGSVFEHELTHAMGWQHWWANGQGSTPDWSSLAGRWMPARMFGWTDLDGDGVIEIMDPTPYGIQ
jgi:hypothetical protein